jgi:hypothetical protein
MRAMNALGRQLRLKNAWAASGTGTTRALAALFASAYNNDNDLRNAPDAQSC